MTWRIRRTALALAAVLVLGMAVPARGSAEPPDEGRLDETDLSTLTQMLHWSLSNQDLEALHSKAEAIRASAPAERPPGLLPEGGAEGGPKISQIDQAEAERLHALKAAQRAKELSSMMDTLVPDRAQQLRDALARALGESEGGASTEARVGGLHELEELVEDIDNARDFVTLGGFARLVPMLAETAAPDVQAAAAWAIGSGAQNNAEIQAHLCEIGAPASLVSMLVGTPSAAHSADVDSKALYALSAISRDSAVGAAALVAHNGLGALALALRRPSTRVVRKALTLLTDLARNSELSPIDGADARATSVRMVVRPDGDSGGADEGAGGSGRGGGGADGGALAHSLEVAIANNASAVCDAIASQLEAGLGAHDVDTLEKAVEAADALIASPRFGPHIVGSAALLGAGDAPGREAGCARTLRPQLGELVDAARTAAGAAAASPDGADAAPVWQQVASTAMRLQRALADASAASSASE